MNTYRPSQSSNVWMIAIKLLVLILGLYISAVVLGKVFTWLFAIAFFLIRFVVIIAASFLVLHVLLKLLFKIDLIKVVFGSRFTQRF
ncbi:hypothetical protein Desaci_3106 [Desulfosporosinus acidiphilus SJ4]|uniref:Uncharacterized protein n=1 Tax=Desulfosporosinus acidiphilus (strain DSM 22704 / JCM 16185 / SJ4) TaxID=646529 RepID=I4D889_DESAJ|nr:hypothetical protein [Desulfosporosinus acidiphilus]AFM42013.1 hypothetical protein Desaci_3106 [Desulfosporosinus acidiphilus SJ4]